MSDVRVDRQSQLEDLINAHRRDLQKNTAATEALTQLLRTVIEKLTGLAWLKNFVGSVGGVLTPPRRRG